MAKDVIRVLVESNTGLNTKLSINGKVVTNNQAYKMAKDGKLNGYHGVNRNGTKFIQSNPDNSKTNNLG